MPLLASGVKVEMLRSSSINMSPYELPVEIFAMIRTGLSRIDAALARAAAPVFANHIAPDPINVNRIAVIAASEDALETLVFLSRHRLPDRRGAARAAAKHGSLRCLKFLCSLPGAKFDHRLLREAIRGGDIECIDYIRTAGVPVEADDLIIAAGRPNVQCLRYVYDAIDDDDIIDTNPAACHATVMGHIENLHYLMSLGGVDNIDDLFCEALRVGRLDLIEYINTDDLILENPNWYIRYARGRLDMFKWLFETKDVGMILYDGLHEAVKYNRKDTIDYLLSKGAKFTRGYIPIQNKPMLDWLCSRGCDMQMLQQYEIYWHGNFKLLTWLHDRGCKIDNDCLCMAITNGDYTHVRWFIEEAGCKFEANIAELETALRSVIFIGDFQMLKYLFEVNIPRSSNIDKYIDTAHDGHSVKCYANTVCGHGKIIEYLREM